MNILDADDVETLDYENVEDMLRIVLCKIYLTYLTGGRNARKNVVKFLNKMYVILCYVHFYYPYL